MADEQAVAAPAKAKKEAEVELVTMEDGSKVEFTGKRKINKDSGIDEAGNLVLTMDFRNGARRRFTLNPALKDKFALHGAEQKYGDEAAGIEQLDDAVIAIDSLHDRLTKGEWTQAREANAFSGASLVIRALMEATSKTQEQVKTFLEAKLDASKSAAEADPTQKALTRAGLYQSLRQSEKLKPIIARLEAERAAKGSSKVDSAELLAELESA